MTNNIKQVLFTTSFRSGSALATRILNAHSDITITMDKLKFFRYAFEKYLPLDHNNITKMVDDLNTRLEGRFEITLEKEKCIEAIMSQPLQHATIYAILLKNMLRATSSEVIGEMENLAWSKIPYFLNNFPKGKAIMIIRDLRDQLVSFKKLTYAPADDYLIALFNNIDSMMSWIDYEKSYPNRFLGIRFENLKRDTENEARKMCDFLGVEFESGMLLEENWMELSGNQWCPWKNKKVSSFHKDGVHLNPVGRWKDIITEEDLFLCEWLGRDVMKKFNIKKEGPTTVKQEVFDNAMKKLNSSELLRDAFKKWCETGRGVEKYPIDPLNPKNWDKDSIINPEKFGLNIK